MAGDVTGHVGDEAASTQDARLEAFVGKWMARWPEWSVAEVFMPRAHRPVALAWASLQQELTDAAWGGSDARPGEAKLLWWQEELHGWSQGRRRHPLGATLQRSPASWSGLAAALPCLGDSRERPADAADAYARLLPLATAVSGIEQALFAGGTIDGPPDGPSDTPAARLAVATWLHARLAREGAAAVPLAILARRIQTDVDHDGLGAWRDELVRNWPAADGATRPRRLWAAMAHARLLRGAADQPLPVWSALWTAWRAARN